MSDMRDSGAQMLVMGLKQAQELGVVEETLIPTTVTIQVANGVTERALGMLMVFVICKDTSRSIRATRQQAYVMKGADQLYLSQEAMEDLGCIQPGVFP